jgi:hypothetical protein
MKKTLFFLLLISLSLSAKVPAPRSKRYNLSICAIFKNETKYLKEWIEYHRLVGVDHFYLYNNNSFDRSTEVLRPYIKQNIVTLTSWPDCLGNVPDEKAYLWSLSTQISAFENAILLRAKETEWMVIVDVDEFLIPILGDKLTDILARYKEYPGIILEKEFYDASRIDVLPKRNLVIEAVDLMGSPQLPLQKSVEKVIFKPQDCEVFSWPPFKPVFKQGQKPVFAAKGEMRINHYMYRNKGYLYSHAKKERLNIDNRSIPDTEVQELLKAGYEIEDEDRVIFRFVPDVLKKMGY